MSTSGGARSSSNARTGRKEIVVDRYMNEKFYYGGKIMTRAAIQRDLESLGLPRAAVDRYMMGLQTGRQIGVPGAAEAEARANGRTTRSSAIVGKAPLTPYEETLIRYRENTHRSAERILKESPDLQGKSVAQLRRMESAVDKEIASVRAGQRSGAIPIAPEERTSFAPGALRGLYDRAANISIVRDHLQNLQADRTLRGGKGESDPVHYARTYLAQTQRENAPWRIAQATAEFKRYKSGDLSAPKIEPPKARETAKQRNDRAERAIFRLNMWLNYGPGAFVSTSPEYAAASQALDEAWAMRGGVRL